MVGVAEEVKARKPTGRPPLYSEELGEAVCDLVAAGKTVKQIGDTPGMPASSILFRWLDKYPAFRDGYLRARELAAHASESNIMDYMGRLSIGDLDANAARVLINAEQWLAAKRAPRTHGDRVEVEHSGAIQGGLGPVIIQITAHQPAQPAQAIDCQAVKPAIPCADAIAASTLDK